MSFLQKFIIGCTLVFGVLVATAIYISQQSMEFKNHHEQFVRGFMSDFTYSWELKDVETKMSEDFWEQAATEEGEAYLKQFRVLGPVQKIDEIDMGKYFSGSDGTRGEFIFRAAFQSKDVLVKLTVHEQAGDVRIQGITINSLDEEGRRTDFQPDS